MKLGSKLILIGIGAVAGGSRPTRILQEHKNQDRHRLDVNGVELKLAKVIRV